MPVEVEVDAESGIGTMRIVGRVEPEEGIEALRQLWNSPDYRFDFLLDLREFDGDQVDASYLRQVGDLMRRERPDAGEGRVVYLVRRDVDFGTSRMAQVYFEKLPFDILVTRSHEEAMKFLTRRDAPREDTPSASS